MESRFVRKVQESCSSFALERRFGGSGYMAVRRLHLKAVSFESGHVSQVGSLWLCPPVLRHACRGGEGAPSQLLV